MRKKRCGTCIYFDQDYTGPGGKDICRLNPGITYVKEAGWCSHHKNKKRSK